MILLKSEGLQFYLGKLRSRRPFSFVRYGNGEWGCVLGTANRTASGSQNLRAPGLRLAMSASLLNAPPSEDYLMGLQSAGYLRKIKLYGRIEAWVDAYAPDIVWYAADVFHRCSSEGGLAPLARQMREMQVIVVGPKHLRDLHACGVFDPIYFIEVEGIDCWKGMLAAEEEILAKAATGTVVSFSAGPTAKVLIHRLFPYIGDKVFLIDFGSLWDVFVGCPSREYQRNMDEATIVKNLG